MKTKIKNYILSIAIFYFFFIAVSFFMPPLFVNKTEVKSNYALISDTEKNQYERVLSIDDNYSAMLWRLRLINSAKDEIIFSTFDLRTDESGKTMLAALLTAAKRGINIKILVDGLSAERHLDDIYLKALLSFENVSAKFYNPVMPWSIWDVNYRMHDKYLIIDQKAYLIGGRNTNDYFLSEKGLQKTDREVLVYQEYNKENSSLNQLKKYFYSVWNLKICKKQSFKRKSKIIDMVFSELEKLYANAILNYPKAFLPFDWKECTLKSEKIILLSNPIYAKNKKPTLWNQLFGIMKSGKDIIIETPYAILNQNMYNDLNALCKDRKVTIFTNAVENNSNPFGACDYLSQKQKLLDCGVNIKEYMGNWSLHTKTIIVDHDISIVGSFNFDCRSTYLSTETMIAIKSKELNQYIREKNSEMSKYCNIIYSNGTSAIGEKYQVKSLPFLKRVFYFILKYVLIPFRYLF